MATFAGNVRLLLTVNAIMLTLSVSGQGIDSLQTDTMKTQNLRDVTVRLTLISAEDPWSPLFDTTMVWGPVHGAMFYAGVRVNIGRL